MWERVLGLAQEEAFSPHCAQAQEKSRHSARRGVNPEGRRHSSAQLHWPLRCSAMISLFSLMSALIEAPEDILNLQDHCLRPKGFIQAQRFALNYIATSY
jgi:hypothetical protein